MYIPNHWKSFVHLSIHVSLQTYLEFLVKFLNIPKYLQQNSFLRNPWSMSEHYFFIYALLYNRLFYLYLSRERRRVTLLLTQIWHHTDNRICKENVPSPILFLMWHRSWMDSLLKKSRNFIRPYRSIQIIHLFCRIWLQALRVYLSGKSISPTIHF